MTTQPPGPHQPDPGQGGPALPAGLAEAAGGLLDDDPGPGASSATGPTAGAGARGPRRPLLRGAQARQGADVAEAPAWPHDPSFDADTLQERVEPLVEAAFAAAVSAEVAQVLARDYGGAPLSPAARAFIAQTTAEVVEKVHAGGGDPHPLGYPDSGAFLEDYLLANYEPRPDTTWCPRWWDHAEAVTRIEALWRSWEAMRWDGPTALSAWWRDHADHHMAVLTNRQGPFHACLRGHTGPHRYPTEPEPAPEQRDDQADDQAGPQ